MQTSGLRPVQHRILFCIVPKQGNCKESREHIGNGLRSEYAVIAECRRENLQDNEKEHALPAYREQKCTESFADGLEYAGDDQQIMMAAISDSETTDSQSRLTRTTSQSRFRLPEP